MKSLTAPELCDLVGMNFKRFETLRRRYRAESAKLRAASEEQPTFPVMDDQGGGWTRYGYDDVLKLAITLQFERQGLDFQQGSRIAWNSLPVLVVASSDRDIWVGRQQISEPSAGEIEPFVRGYAEEVFAPVYTSGVLNSIVACNVSALHRRLQPKFLALADPDANINTNGVA